MTVPPTTLPAGNLLPGDVIGSQQCGLYDVNVVRAPQNYVTFADTLGVDRTDIVTGYEISVNARLAQAFISGGVNFNNQHLDFQAGSLACDFIDSPEVRFCETDTSYRPDLKLNGSYLLPYDVQVSATYRGLAGPQAIANWAATNAVITPGLGRPLTSGATKTIALMEPGTEFFSMRHVFDMRFSKTVPRESLSLPGDDRLLQHLQHQRRLDDQHDVRRQPAQADGSSKRRGSSDSADNSSSDEDFIRVAPPRHGARAGAGARAPAGVFPHDHD